METIQIPAEGTEVKVRLFKTRHYGGRILSMTPIVCRSKFFRQQPDGTYLVELLEPCDGFRAGHVISVIERNFNIQ